MDTTNAEKQTSVDQELKLLNEDIQRYNTEEKQKKETDSDNKPAVVSSKGEIVLPQKKMSYAIGGKAPFYGIHTEEEEKVAIPTEKTNLNIKVPFFKKMETTIKSLEKGEYKVKRDGDLWSVVFKRIIVIEKLFDEMLAINFAKKYNNVTKEIRDKLKNSMETAQNEVQETYKNMCKNLPV